jgi:hypothetical protein
MPPFARAIRGDFMAAGGELSAPLSLYLDLKPGEAADLDVVAKAALQWSAALKEIAFIVDPSCELRIELESGTAGSLSLNAKLRAIGPAIKTAAGNAMAAAGQMKAIATDPQTVRTVVISVAIWAAMNGAEYAFGRLLDYMTGADAPPEAAALSDEDKADIARRVVEALRNESATKPVRSMYRELERDTAIVGAGITARPGKRPEHVVPRERFSEMAAQPEPQVQEADKRTVPERMRVRLVRAILERGDKRWGFRGPYGEFGAPVKHAEFLDAVLSGTSPVPMVEGIEMTIDLETSEELEGGVWVPKKREVVRVLELHPPSTQSLLFPSPPDG